MTVLARIRHEGFRAFYSFRPEPPAGMPLPIRTRLVEIAEDDGVSMSETVRRLINQEHRRRFPRPRAAGPEQQDIQLDDSIN